MTEPITPGELRAAAERIGPIVAMSPTASNASRALLRAADTLDAAIKERDRLAAVVEAARWVERGVDICWCIGESNCVFCQLSKALNTLAEGETSG